MMTRDTNEVITMRQAKPRRVLAISNRGTKIWSTKVHDPGEIIEAYSVAGEIGFGWWLVEHYLSYHVDCPNSCGLGEPARGR